MYTLVNVNIMDALKSDITYNMLDHLDLTHFV